MKIVIHHGIVSAALIALACQAGRAADPPAPTPPGPPGPRPTVIYVTDFHLDPAQIESKGPLGGERKGILGRRRGILRNNDPEDKSREFVGILADAIIKHLRSAGLNAEYLPNVQAEYIPPETGGRLRFVPGTPPLPGVGWLVTGWFEEVKEGAAAVEATVGFGAGSGKAEAAVAVSDLARDAGQPFIVLGSGSRTRRMPGGLIAKNPYVMAAKFVMDRRNGTEKDIKSLGTNIAKNLVEYISRGASQPK
ncbi:MAG TPA: DUF4410 domain-containing protein [Verrucomicrobiae bacterium]|nr:DUF4410 domain-containing protein [Verrucomicrobiae bacterium]